MGEKEANIVRQSIAKQVDYGKYERTYLYNGR